MEKKIITYLEGKLPKEEQKKLLEWIREANNQSSFNTIKEEWWKGKQAQQNIDRGMHRLTERLNDKKQLVNSRKLKRIYQYAAAVLLLISMGSSILLTRSYLGNSHLQATEIRTDYGQMSNILLPDSTEVWINSGTKLVYNNQYGVKNRDIKVKGEAFFSVIKNKEISFVVDMGKLEVVVTGTKFGVSNYDDSKLMNVVLEEGSVNIQSAFTKELLMKLNPNQMASFNQDDNTIERTVINTEHYTSWRNGIINIFEMPLHEIVLKLEKRFNQKFTVEPEIADLPFTFSIESESLSDIINLLEKISPIRAEQSGDLIKLKYKP